jgi:hypothetical protein
LNSRAFPVILSLAKALRQVRSDNRLRPSVLGQECRDETTS